jgi:hypothetical protein
MQITPSPHLSFLLRVEYALIDVTRNMQAGQSGRYSVAATLSCPEAAIDGRR